MAQGQSYCRPLLQRRVSLGADGRVCFFRPNRGISFDLSFIPTEKLQTGAPHVSFMSDRLHITNTDMQLYGESGTKGKHF